MSDISSIRYLIGTLLPSNMFNEITAAKLREAFDLVLYNIGPLANQEYASTASVVTVNAQVPFDDSVPQSTEGVEVITVSLTSTSATSNILISYTVTGSTDHNAAIVGAVFQDSNTSALTSSVMMTQTTGADQRFTLSGSFQVPSIAIGARTYKLRLGTDSSSVAYVNADATGTRLFGGACVASIQAMEVGS